MKCVSTFIDLKLAPFILKQQSRGMFVGSQTKIDNGTSNSYQCPLCIAIFNV